uniref:Protein kinase domain-containing protein n=1 Tax=Elaeophora elaphi TaxID=1147741 RepID=A0A0R3RTN0_9BILA
MDTLGHCIASSSNHQNYIFRLELTNSICYRCVVIFSVHPNILQYKQSRCINKHESSNDNIENICRHAFRGDTPMKTLFKTDAKSEQCPFKPPFNFTYTTQDGACRSRVSSVTACSEYGKYRFQYEACPELPNYERHGKLTLHYKFRNSEMDELECIAHWNSFGMEFFAVRITNSSITVPKTIFRCLIYQKTASGGYMGMSADSSCDELTDLTYAGMTIEYMQNSPPKSYCHFPLFLEHSHYSSNKHKWISLTTGSVSNFYSDKWIEATDGMNDTVSQCLQMEHIGNVHKMLVYKTTKQCTNGYQCIKLKRRHKNIIEITYNELMNEMPSSCNLSKDHFIDTMALVDAQVTRCPFSRHHFVKSCTNSIAQFGCTYDHELIIPLNCSNTSSEKFSCIGYWRENEVEYIVSRKSASFELLCHVYSSDADGMTYIRSYRRSSCYSGFFKEPEPYHDITFAKYDDCFPLNGVSRKTESDSSLASIFILSLAVILYSSFG